MSRDLRHAGRTLVPLAPMIAWLTVGVLLLDARSDASAEERFCREVSTIAAEEVTAWITEGGTDDTPIAPLIVRVVRRVEEAGLGDEVPAPLRARFSDVEREVARSARAKAGGEPSAGLVDATERFVASYVEACGSVAIDLPGPVG